MLLYYIYIYTFICIRSCIQLQQDVFCLFFQGIGDSGQGFVNALLFCVFTPKVRKKLVLCVVNSKYNFISKHRNKENDRMSNLLHSLSTKQGSPSGSSNSSATDQNTSHLT